MNIQNFLSRLVPNAIVRRLLAAAVVFAAGSLSQWIVSKHGTQYELAPGVVLTITKQHVDLSTNAVWKLVKVINAELERSAK